jgi:uncharacterized SAM-binding protein YcdF (DUF218 family)
MHPARNAAWTLATVFAVLSIALIAATARLLLWPETDSPVRADAVVVLAGGQGERLTKALELIHADTAPTLVIGNGDDPKWAEANRLCSGTSSFEVICFRPDPDNTRGEARVLGSLAERRGWQSLVVVTSTYHVTRARLLVRRCFAGKTSFVAAPPSGGAFHMFLNVTREWAGLASSLAHGC